MAELHTDESPRPRDEPQPRFVATTERTGEGDVYHTGTRYVVAEPAAVDRITTVVAFHDRVRWGPIIAGLVTAFTALLVFLLLGLALGLSVFGPDSNENAVSAAAGIWAAISALLAFVIGGWMAGRMAEAEHTDIALLNGFIVGAAGVVLVLWLALSGIGNLAGLLGNTAASILHDAVNNPGALRNALTNAGSLVNNSNVANVQSEARNGAWYALITIVAGLLAATFGAWLGHAGHGGFHVRGRRVTRAAR